MAILLTTFFLSMVVQLTAGTVFPLDQPIIPLVLPKPTEPDSSRPGPSTYYLQDKVMGRDFLSFFYWETEADPTHGRVNYVDQSTALKRGLTEGKSSKLCGKVY